MGCLDNVIKLSRTDCECYTDESPMPSISEGQSEVYLDELEGLNLAMAQAAEDCSKGNLWELMDRARTNGTLALKADLMSCMQDNYIAKRPNYTGLIGEAGFNSTLTISNTYAGQVLVPHRVVGGKIKINRIGLAMNATASITVSIYDNDQYYTTPLATYSINSSANAMAYAVLATPLELPMWSNNIDNLEYYIVYTISGFQPKNNKAQCVPCSGGKKNVIWSNWLSVYGIAGNNTEYSDFTRTKELNGVVIDAELTCNAARVICSDEYPLDFENDGKAMQIAFAIRYKAGAILIDDILSSPEINRYTMLDREALYGKRNHYRAKYEQWVEYLCKTTEALNNDCWACRPNSLIKKGSILA